MFIMVDGTTYQGSIFIMVVLDVTTYQGSLIYQDKQDYFLGTHIYHGGRDNS